MGRAVEGALTRQVQTDTNSDHSTSSIEKKLLSLESNTLRINSRFNSLTFKTDYSRPDT